jgi:hypothetical protein
MCGGSAPPPDPRIGEAADAQAQLAQQQWANYQQNFEPLQVQGAQNQLSTQQFQLQQAQKYANLYDNTTAQALQTFHNDVGQFNTDSYRETLAGQAASDAQQAYATNQAGLQRSEAARGMNPGSAAALWADRGMAASSAASQTQAMNATRLAAMQMGWNLKAQDAGLGAGVAGYGLNAASGAAGTGAALAGSNSGLSGATGSSMAGYQGQMQGGMDISQINEQNYQAQQSMYGALAGGLMGLGGSAMGMYGMTHIPTASDRRLKTDIRPVGTLNNGITVYTYRYKWGGGYHIGVMADEVKEIKPEAYAKGVFNGYDGVYYERL